MRNIVITSGGTTEYIDKVRKITNVGKGTLGEKIANELLKDSNNNVIYICSKNAIRPQITNKNQYRLTIIEIETTMDLKDAVINVLKTKTIDYFIHSMAVSDYYIDYVSTISLLNEELNKTNDFENVLNKPVNTLDNTSKISSNENNLVVVLKQTPKIIGLIKQISPKTHLVGFKLLENVEREELFSVAKKIRDKNDCDYVVANDLKDIRNGNHKAFLIDKENKIIEMNGKDDIAKHIKNII